LALPLLLATGDAGGAEGPAFLRGDANSDGQLSIADSLMIRRFLFNMATAPQCLDTGDLNDDNLIDITDAIMILGRIFRFRGFEEVIAAPFPERGEDETPDELPCDSYEVTPPQTTDDLIRIGEVSASPGQEVEIPVYLTTSVEVESFQLVILYDPALFTSYKGSFDFSETPWEEAFDGTKDDGFAALDAYPEDGFFVLGVLGSVTGRNDPEMGRNYHPIPAGDDLLVVKIRGRVAQDARPGTTVELEPTNGPDGQGVVPPFFLRNEISREGDARFVSFFPRTLGGRIAIVEDLGLFSRGDANADRLFDVSDAIFVFSFLFLGGPDPSCKDAADANDDGSLDLSDGVAILGQLFLGEEGIPPPFPSRGSDPTPDELTSCGSGGS
jgi:hypothetical protein